MNRHIKLLELLFSAPWYYDQTEGMRILPYVLQACMGQSDTPGFSVALEDTEPRPKSTQFLDVNSEEDFAYHFYSGAVGKYLGMSEGGIDLNRMDRHLRAFADHDTQHTFIAHLDTPGGAGYGLRQLGTLIEWVGNETGKTIVAYTDTLACSAGQWIAASCDHFYMDVDAKAGSVGVYSVLLSARRALEQAGIDATMFASGKHKGAGHPAFDLTEEQKTEIQRSVDNLGELFRSEMCRMRGVEIDPELLQGQSLSAEVCESAGIIDGIVSSIYDVFDIYR